MSKHDKADQSFQERVEENIGAKLFREAPPKGFRGVKFISTIINVARKMEAEFNGYIRSLSIENADLAARLATVSDELATARVKLYEAEIRLRAHGLDLTEKQTQKLLGVAQAA